MTGRSSHTSPTLFIIAACTTRKRLSSDTTPRLREIPPLSIAERVDRWRALQRKSTQSTVKARNLYAGEYWSIIRGLPSHCQKPMRPQLYVASAGYGLLRDDQQIKGYSATFSTGHPDSVKHTAPSQNSPSTTRSQWWTCVTGRRTIERLAQKHNTARFLVIASPDYLDAMADDLQAARDALKNPDTLVLLSSRLPPALRNLETTNLVASVAKLELSKDFVGGTRSSLHARTARHLLTSVTPKTFLASKLRRKYRRKVKPVKPA